MLGYASLVLRPCLKCSRLTPLVAIPEVEQLSRERARRAGDDLAKIALICTQVPARFCRWSPQKPKRPRQACQRPPGPKREQAQAPT